MTFTDNPTLAPKDAKVEVRSYISTPSDTGGSGFARAVTQREFARRLAIELDLDDRSTAEAAAEALAAVGIAPRLGKWDLDGPMTTALIERLRTLTVGAALAGKIALDPEQAVFAFNSTAALVGIKIRGAAAAPEPMAPAEVPVAPAPAPVYVAPVAESLGERVIYVGGGVVDPFFAGALPTTVINKRVINIDNRVVVRKRAKPRQRVQRRVARAKTPSLGRKQPYAGRSRRAVAVTRAGQPRGGATVTGRTVVAPRQVSVRRVVRHMRPNPGRAMARGAGARAMSGGYRVR